MTLRNFVYKSEWLRGMQAVGCSLEEIAQVLIAMVDYVETGAEPDFEDRTLLLMWQMIRPQLDAEADKYERRCKANKVNALHKKDPAGATGAAPAPAIEYTPAFDKIWQAYGRKGKKPEAYEQYQARLAEGYTYDDLTSAISTYFAEQTDPKYRQGLQRFLGPDMTFEQYITDTANPTPTAVQEDAYTPMFEVIMQEYPWLTDNGKDTNRVWTQYRATLADGVTEEQMLDALLNYMQDPDRKPMTGYRFMQSGYRDYISQEVSV